MSDYQRPDMPDNFGNAMQQPTDRQALYAAMRFLFADREHEFFTDLAMTALYRGVAK